MSSSSSSSTANNSNNLPSPQTLAGKVAIVTGSSRGLGRTMALHLAKHGAKIVITYTSQSSRAKVDELVSEISALQQNDSAAAAATSFQADLTEVEAAQRIVKHTLAVFHRIDILVNNAAMELVKPLTAITPAELGKVYDLNVRAPLLLLQSSIPYMGPNSRVINISSVGARAGFANLSAYCSSKAALEALTRCWAAELGHNGTTVNAVAPGPVESEMLDNIPKELVEQQKQATPVQKRLGRPEQVAEIVTWLAGEGSAWVSGQTINASGGWTMY